MSNRGIAHMKDRVVNPNEFWKKEGQHEEKVIREFARELEILKDPDYACISWDSQVKAIEYYNSNGFVKTLNRMLELRERNSSE